MFAVKDTAPKPGVYESVLGKGVEIEGTVQSRGSIRIDGKIQGKIRCAGDVMIGESAVLNADVEGDSVTIAGSVTGNVKSSGRLEILPSGKLKGDMASGSLVISEGARFSGSSQMAESSENPRKIPGEKAKE